jgi:hypothetical protein
MASATAFGPITGPVGSIMWLPVTARGKIGTGWVVVNAYLTVESPEESMSLTLLAAIVSLLAWVTLVFLASVSAGAVHLLLALSATLLVRWWALRA